MAARVIHYIPRGLDIWTRSLEGVGLYAKFSVAQRCKLPFSSWCSLKHSLHATRARRRVIPPVSDAFPFVCTMKCCTNSFSSSSKAPEDISSELMKEVEGENLSKHGRTLSPTDAVMNVGKMVPHRVLNLIDENGETLKAIRSSRAVALAQERDLKLVMINQHVKPLPLYRLMTGKELHAEQVKMNEKKKSRAHPTVMKDVKLTSGIGQNDLNVKRNHIADWVAKEPHIQIRVTVTQKGRVAATKEDMEAIIHQLIDDMEVPLVFNNQPKLTGKNQQFMSVVIRPMSAKEKAKLNKEKKARGVTPTVEE